MMFQPIDRPMPRPLPYTVERVVELLYQDISLRDRSVIAQLSESALTSLLYVEMAETIRKEFKIYTENTDLLDSCRKYIARKYTSLEDPVMVIIKELWEKTKKQNRLHLVVKK